MTSIPSVELSREYISHRTPISGGVSPRVNLFGPKNDWPRWMFSREQFFCRHPMIMYMRPFKSSRDLAVQQQKFEDLVSGTIKLFERGASQGRVSFRSIYKDWQFVSAYAYDLERRAANKETFEADCPELEYYTRVDWISRILDNVSSYQDEVSDRKLWFSDLASGLKTAYAHFSGHPVGAFGPTTGVETYKYSFLLPLEVEQKHFPSLPALRECGRKVTEMAGLGPDSRCLEIGSGNGIMRDIIPLEVDLDMTDFNPIYCALNTATHPYSRVSAAEGWKLNAPSSSYDAVFELGVLDVADNVGGILAEIRRVLTDRGTFIHLMDFCVVDAGIYSNLNLWSRELLGGDISSIVPGEVNDDGKAKIQGFVPEDIARRMEGVPEGSYDRKRLELLHGLVQKRFSNNRLYEDFLEIELMNHGFGIETHKIVSGSADVERDTLLRAIAFARECEMFEKAKTVASISWDECGRRNSGYICSSNPFAKQEVRDTLTLEADMMLLVARKLN